MVLVILMVVSLVGFSWSKTQVEVGQGYQYGFAMSDTSQAFDSYSFYGLVYRPLFPIFENIQWKQGYVYRYSPTKFHTLSGEHLNTIIGGLQIVNPIGETPMTIRTGIGLGWTIPSIDYFYNSAFTFMVESKVYFNFNYDCCGNICTRSFYGGIGYIRDNFRNGEVLQSLTPMIGVVVRQ